MALALLLKQSVVTPRQSSAAHVHYHHHHRDFELVDAKEARVASDVVLSGLFLLLLYKLPGQEPIGSRHVYIAHASRKQSHAPASPSRKTHRTVIRRFPRVARAAQ